MSKYDPNRKLRRDPSNPDKFYNEDLSRAFAAAYKRSEIGLLAMAEILQISRSSVNFYVSFERTIIRSDVERKIVVVTKILNDMCDEGIFPLPISKHDAGRVSKYITAFNDYLDSLTK